MKLLDAVLRRGLAFEAAVGREADGAEARGAFEGQDRALAHALAREVLRWLPDLDALIDGATAKPLPDDAKARMLLRIALAGTLVHGTPAHAAIATVLPLAEGGPKRLVHGVFGTLSRGGARLPEAPSLPAGIDARWRAAWGDGMTGAARAALGAQAPLDVTLRDAGETAAYAEALGGVSLFPGRVRVAAAKFSPALPGFAAGSWWVQDLAASLPAALLGAEAGEAVADLCAAPGGKTLQLAATGATVSAVDIAPKRLARVEENLRRTRLDATVIAHDALSWRPRAPLQRVLLDAPCSATGVFRRHPDVLHLKAAANLQPLVTLQAALLARAAEILAPGGTLVYATCSLEPAEGEEQLAALLARRADVAVEPIRADELPAGLTPHPGGWLRTLPGDLADAGGVDGFFIARLRKLASRGATGAN